MHKPVIVIVDSGVDSSHPQLINDEISEIVLNKQDAGHMDKIYGHGTAIYGIIRNCLDIADIINIKVCGIEKGVTEEVLISVLQYIETNIEVNIINLSLGIGVVHNIRALKDICDKLTKKGVIIVSAFDNTGSISYPAAFDNVIGVVSSNDCKITSDFSIYKDTIINIAAKGGTQRVLWNQPKYLIMSGNSLACAHVTVQVAKFYHEGICNKEQILNEFLRISKYQYVCKDNIVHQKIFPIKRAVIFPFNKEMHSLMRFYNNLSFEIVDVYDVKYSAKVGVSTKRLMMDDDVADFQIKNIDNIDYNSFDTLILGHLDELSVLINEDTMRSQLLEDLIKHNKNIYAFDDLYKSNGVKKSDKIYYPTVSMYDMPENRFGMLYRASKPVLGIFGTSSRQGKFTLQLNLRDLLSKRGYNVGQIGSEPSSLLYGMDYVYPMGYNSSVYITEYDCLRYLNHIIHTLCEDEKDIIIVGSQSGTVQYDIGNICYYNIPQYTFLLGTLPDAVILCVNPFDDIEYIKRTIAFIESGVKCCVIALVVFPMDIDSGWTGVYGNKKTIEENKLKDMINNLINDLNLPVFCLGNKKDYMSIVNLIEDYFS